MFLDAAAGFVELGVILALYMLPSIIAWSRHHHNAWAVTALNFLAGWTFVGWIAAFVWSLTRPAPAPVVAAPAERPPL